MAQLKNTTIDGALDVSEDISVDGTLAFLSNNTSKIYGTLAEGGTREVFCPVSSGGNTTINYGAYEAEAGDTNIYGNGIALKAHTTITADVPVETHSITATCGTAITLSTSYKRIPMKTFTTSGNGDSFFTCVTSPYNGVKCNRAGKVLVSGCVYALGLTGGNSVIAVLYRNDVGVGGQVVANTPTARTYTVPIIAPTVLNASVGDVFSLCIYNYNTAAGEVAANARTRLTLTYLD